MNFLEQRCSMLAWHVGESRVQYGVGGKCAYALIDDKGLALPNLVDKDCRFCQLLQIWTCAVVVPGCVVMCTDVSGYGSIEGRTWQS